MSPHHDSSHERTLTAVLAGDLAPEAALADASIRGCDECSAQLEELTLVRGDLEDMGREAREVLAAAAALPETPHADLVANVLGARVREHQAELEASARPRSWRRPLAVAAAVAAAVLFLLYRFDPSPTPGATGPGSADPREQRLGGRSGVSVLAPIGAVDRWSTFRWEPPATEHLYEVRVYAVLPDGLARDPAAVSPRTGASTWALPEDELSALPDRIRWELRVFDTTGAYVESIWCDAVRGAGGG